MIHQSTVPPSDIADIAMENAPFMEEFPISMILSHSYVKLPEGIGGIIPHVLAQLAATRLTGNCQILIQSSCHIGASCVGAARWQSKVFPATALIEANVQGMYLKPSAEI